MDTRTRNELPFVVRLGLLGLGAFALATVPAACIYPEYSFDEPEPTGASSSVGGQGGTGGQGSTTSNTSTSNTSTSSSGTGAGGMGSTGGTGGSMPGVEDCLNSADDDGDGMIDCMDTDCQAGYTCVPKLPVGWAGFVTLFEGTPAAEPNCPNAFPSATPYKGNNTPTTPAHTCSACSCGAPTGQSCDLPDIITIQNKVCGQTPTATGTLNVPNNWTGSCYGPDGYPGATTCGGLPCNTSATSEKPTVTGGSCAPSGGTPSLPPVSWAIMGKACGDAPTGLGCQAGMVCQPKPEGQFLPGLCIYKPNDVSCPATDFTKKHVFYEDAMDTRGCSTCTCGAPAGSMCDASISLYSDQNVNTCTTEVLTFTAGSCANITANPPVVGRKATITSPPSGGSCAVSGGGQATGALAPTNAMTFCCQ